VAAEPGEVPALAAPYQAADATWWIETANPEPEWRAGSPSGWPPEFLAGRRGAEALTTQLWSR